MDSLGPVFSARAAKKGKLVTASRKPKRHPDTAFRQVGDEGGLVVLPGRSEVKVLNPVGIKIFSMLDGTHTGEEIIQAVQEEFEVTEEQAREDLSRFLEELDRNGMLEAETAETTG